MPTLAAAPFSTALMGDPSSPPSSGETGQRLALPSEALHGLIHLAAALMLNLAEDADTAQKMLRRGILGSLQQLLLMGSTDPSMQLLVLTFLLRLSAFPKAVTEMLTVVPAVLALLPGSRPEAASIALRLLHNMALDEKGAAAMGVSDGIAQATYLPFGAHMHAAFKDV